MFVLLFAFVFGGAIVIPGGGDYKSFLMPGIFAQTIVFAAGTTAIGMTDDIAKGIVDRFRSLPIAHSAVLTGRTFADVIYNAGILFVLMATGFVIGWRVDTGIGSLIAGFGLLLLFAYAMVWLGVFLGLNVPTVEVGQQVIFTVLFPITFISTAFVPLASLPSWLQPIAEWNPTSTLTNSLRELWGNPNPSGGTSLATTEPDPRHARLGRRCSSPSSPRSACASSARSVADGRPARPRKEFAGARTGPSPARSAGAHRSLMRRRRGPCRPTHRVSQEAALSCGDRTLNVTGTGGSLRATAAPDSWREFGGGRWAPGARPRPAGGTVGHSNSAGESARPVSCGERAPGRPIPVVRGSAGGLLTRGVSLATAGRWFGRSRAG